MNIDVSASRPHRVAVNFSSREIELLDQTCELLGISRQDAIRRGVAELNDRTIARHGQREM